MDDFEYEERYRVDNPETAQKQLETAGFILSGTTNQTDRWFIPKRINSPKEQAHWFDNEGGYALRLREEATNGTADILITVKRALRGEDHSALSNFETKLTVSGMIQAIKIIGAEFDQAVSELQARPADNALTIHEAKQLIASAGRKEYLVANKQRSTFRSSDHPDVVIDIDTIPALKDSKLGFWASIEFEYKGQGSLKEAEQTIAAVTKPLGYSPDHQLPKALPGLAIPYLAKF